MNEDRYNPFVISRCRRSRALEEKFEELNRKFFDEILPSYQVFLCSRCKSFGHEMSGYCLSRKNKILIRNGMSENSTVQTLVHEMAHARLSAVTGNPHGKRFVSELRRLRRMGAPLSSFEVDMVPAGSPARLTESRIRQAISDALTVEGLPPRQVSRYLELEFMLPSSEIKRRFGVKTAITSIAKELQNSSLKRKILFSSGEGESCLG